MLKVFWSLRISHGLFSIMWDDNKNASEIIESHLPLKKSDFVVFTVPAGGLALLVSITLAGKMMNLFREPFHYKNTILTIIKMRISWLTWNFGPPPPIPPPLPRPITLELMPKDLVDYKLTLVQVMACGLSQCCQRSITKYGSTRPHMEELNVIQYL